MLKQVQHDVFVYWFDKSLLLTLQFPEKLPEVSGIIAKISLFSRRK